MSLLWKIALDGDEAGRLLFAKLPATEAECSACQNKIKMSNRRPTNPKEIFPLIRLSEKASRDGRGRENQNQSDEASHGQVCGQGNRYVTIRYNGQFYTRDNSIQVL
uniref:Uncharacterized protein n=1 Tax=Ditylenchus dipsaci TaxID=166011 RepID=A0A915CMA1_9BILA